MGSSWKTAALLALLPAIALAAPEPTDAPERMVFDPLYFRVPSPWLTPDRLGPPRAQETNYALAAAEALTVNLGTLAVDKLMGASYANISLHSWEQNLSKGWIVDTDDIWENGLLHPVHGSFTFTAARSLGVGFYGSFGYAFAASFLWEEFGETQPPSFNDQLNTPFGGAVFGEVRYRLHRLILDPGGPDPSFWRRLLAFLVEPISGFNELVFHDRYRGPVLLPVSWVGELSLGAVFTAGTTDVSTGATQSGLGPWALTEAHVLYGVPGTPGLRLDQPFDHFDFEISVSATAKGVQPALAFDVRGLLLGKAIEPVDNFGGLWGLFTSYDFNASPLFRTTGFGVGPGVSLMKRSSWLELYLTALAEWIPWGAAGKTILLENRDYHFGPGAQGLLDLRLGLGDRVTARASASEFFVGGSYEPGHREYITRARTSLTVRVYGPHALGVQSDWSFRNATTPQGLAHQRGWVLSGMYTFLSGW